VIATFQTHAECMTELEKQKKGKLIYQRICSNVSCGTASAFNELVGYSIHHRKVVSTAFHVACCPRNNRPLLHQDSITAWKYSNLTVDHENGVKHLKCMTAYLVRQKEAACVDSLLVKFDAQSRSTAWHKVFISVISVIRILASRGLPFRGANQTIGQ